MNRTGSVSQNPNPNSISGDKTELHGGAVVWIVEGVKTRWSARAGHTHALIIPITDQPHRISVDYGGKRPGCRGTGTTKPPMDNSRRCARNRLCQSQCPVASPALFHLTNS